MSVLFAHVMFLKYLRNAIQWKVMVLCKAVLTLSQAINYGLLQTERVCKRVFKM